MSGAPTTTVGPIHFEDFSGAQFERLVFAYHARVRPWVSLEWYGQAGSDNGRDIWGVYEVDGRSDRISLCIFCANWRELTYAKFESDLMKCLAARTGKPDHIRVVCGGIVSATLRDRIKSRSATAGIATCDIWSGVELEEFLRRDAGLLLRRFVNGEAFPENAHELRELGQHADALDDNERLALIARAFDRPAFWTSIHQESSLPAFRQAIGDTIEVLNTGIWRTRDGIVIGHLPSRHDIRSAQVKKTLGDVAALLSKLREAFDDAIRSGRIRHCNCGDKECPVYFIESVDVERRLTFLRDSAINLFAVTYPRFRLSGSART